MPYTYECPNGHRLTFMEEIAKEPLCNECTPYTYARLIHSREEETFASGIKSSKVPRLELIPSTALWEMARTFELGIERKGEDGAWNALSPNQSCLTEQRFIMNRLGHLINHALHLKAVLSGEIEDDGAARLDPGAIMWAGAFLHCVLQKRNEKVTITEYYRKDNPPDQPVLVIPPLDTPF